MRLLHWKYRIYMISRNNKVQCSNITHSGGKFSELSEQTILMYIAIKCLNN